jgi:hypothetical protein
MHNESKNTNGPVEDIFSGVDKTTAPQPQSSSEDRQATPVKVNAEPGLNWPASQPAQEPALVDSAATSDLIDTNQSRSKLFTRKHFWVGLVGLFVLAGASAAYFIFTPTATPVFENQPVLNSGSVLESESDIRTDNTLTQPTSDVVNSGRDSFLAPAQPDSDLDGLTDVEEYGLGTNPEAADSDNDGLYDRDEVEVYGTDPNLADSDNDGYSDGQEVTSGFNPLGEGRLF